jgi:hypothetical protein
MSDFDHICEGAMLYAAALENSVSINTLTA